MKMTERDAEGVRPYDLEPCPFCNGEKLSLIRKVTFAGWNGLDARVDYVRFYVRCNRCFSRGPTAGGKVLYSTHFEMKLPKWATHEDVLKDLARRNWNRRDE